MTKYDRRRHNKTRLMAHLILVTKYRKEYTNDDNVSFPTIKEIERRLRIAANKEVLTEEDSDYFD